MFLTSEINEEGIYAMRFYIRGKPWVVTVDDEVLFYNGQPEYTKVGADGSIWSPLVEKAFAKIKGNYAQANGGFNANGIRSLIGVPVFDYDLAEYRDADLVFEKIKTADDLDYLIGA